MAWNSTPQSARGWLYILQPDAIFKGRVNLANATYPVHEIPYDGVTTGAYTDIQIGQTVLIGSSDGAWDLGRAYVRDTPSGSVIPIGWASRGGNAGEVTLTDNAYITVLDTYEVWRKPQRLTSAGTLLKDYILPGSTPPSPIMHVGDEGGLGHIGFTDGSVLTLDLLDWSGSTLVNSGETWASRLWNFDDGTAISGSTSTADPVVEFPEGKRWIRLYGEGSDGGETYRRYLVVALNPTTPGTVAFNNLRIRRTADGQTLSADLQEYLNPADYPPGSIVMYLAREKRGSTVTITQRFAGWLDIESSFSEATITHTRRGTTITAVDVAGKLAQLKALPSMVANEASQSTWLEMKGANIERYIHRHLAFETTALALTDFTLTGLSGSAAYPFMSFSTMGGNMWGVCDGLARAMGYRLTCDSHGRLWLKKDPMRQDVADRTATVQRTITEADWRSLRWQERARPTIGALSGQNVVISSGYASSLLTPFPDVYSIAPGEVAGQGAGEQSQSIGIVQSQTESNKRIGHDYARMTAPQGLYNVALAHGVDADIEPADMTWVQITATAGNSGYRGPTLTAESGLPISVEISVNAVNGVSTQGLTWERETSGQAGARDPRPTASNANISSSVNTPGAGSTTPRNATGLGLIADIALFCTNNMVHYLSSMLDLLAGGTPEVESVSLSLTGTLGAFAVRADSPNYLNGSGAVNGYLATTSQVRTISDIFDAATLGTAYSYASGAVVQPHQVQLQTERGNPDWALTVTYRDTGGVDAYRTTNGGSAWSTESSLPAFYDSLLPQNAGVWKAGLWMHPDGSGAALVSAFTATGTAPGGDLWQTSDYGATWTKVTTSGWDTGDWLACCIVKPLNSEVVYHGFMVNDAGTGYGYFYRIVGTTATDITPTYSGGEYGVAFFSYAQRSLSVADDNPQAVALIGYDRASGKYGVFQTANALATSPTWNVVITPTTSVKYRGIYYVKSDLIFLFGLDGTFAIARYEGGAWVAYEMTISGAGDIVGICGG